MSPTPTIAIVFTAQPSSRPSGFEAGHLMVAHLVDDALEDAGQFFLGKRPGILRTGMGQNLFPAARIVDLFVEDSFGGRHILDHASTAIEQVDESDINVVDPFPAVLQQSGSFLRRHFFILSESDRARASRPAGSFSICRTIALPTTTP